MSIYTKQVVETKQAYHSHFLRIESQHKKFVQEKAQEATKQKGEKRKKHKPEEHEGMPNISTNLMQSVAEIGTQSTMKSRRKTLH
jgi:hypothetical protein